MLRPDPLPAPLRRRLRLIAWRARRPLAALCAGLAAVLAVQLARPADPPATAVPVAARALAPGTALTAEDVAVTQVPRGLLPLTEVGTVADLVGRRLAVPVPGGLPLVPGLLVDESATGPPGSVVVPVRFADAGVAAVLAPGMRVDVVAAPVVEGGDARRVAQGAVVLAPPTDGTGAGADGATGGGGDGADGAGAGGAPVLLAVTPEESVGLSGAAASHVLSAVIVG